MNRVGILVGREKTFPDALIKTINERGNGKTVAEFITLGGIRHDDPPKYDVVVDRISHEVPFYRATLKRMALEGTTIINNPFWWSADDKFSITAGAQRGFAVHAQCDCHRRITPGIVSESLRNLAFARCQALSLCCLPAFLNLDGGGWKMSQDPFH